jgi:carbon monoxide dehydrogenase subunit G
MTAIILVGVAGVVVLFVAAVSTRPSAYHVERALEVAAPRDRVFGVVDDLRQFAAVLVLFGSPLEKLDPGLQKTFDGPAAGVGQSFAWRGKKAGKARLTIEESIPGQRVGMKLELVAPMKSTATCALTVAETSAGSRVTWSMRGNHNFIGKAFGMFMNMDNLLGTDIEKGLAQLKTIAEGKP